MFQHFDATIGATPKWERKVLSAFFVIGFVGLDDDEIIEKPSSKKVDALVKVVMMIIERTSRA